MAQKNLRQLPLAERHIDPVLDYDSFIKVITPADQQLEMKSPRPACEADQSYSVIIGTNYQVAKLCYEPTKTIGERLGLAYFLLHIYKHGYVLAADAEALYEHGLIDILSPNEAESYIEILPAGQRSIKESLSDNRVLEEILPLIDSVLLSCDDPHRHNRVYMTKSVLDYHRKWRDQFCPVTTLSLNSV